MTHQLDVIAPAWELNNPDAVFSYLGARELLTGYDWKHVSGEGRGVRGHDAIEIVSLARHVELELENTFAEEFFAFAANLSPLAGAAARGVFCGTGSADLGLLKELEKEFGPVLYVANHPDQLVNVATPGPQTLFTPRSPQFHARALGSASFVVSRRLLPCLAARGSGIPTVWLVQSEDEKKIAAEWDLTALETGPRDADLKERVTAVLRASLAIGATKRPAPEIFEKGKRALALAVAKATRLPAALATTQKRTFASISNSHYLPFLEGYIANLLDLYPGEQLCVYVLALDEKVRAALLNRVQGLCEIHVLELADLWTSDQLPEIHRRSIGVQAFSSKPLLIRRAVQETRGTVFYADSDVYFLTRPDAIWEMGTGKGILLFPQWNDAFECSRTDGIFNAGMVVASPPGMDFLDWWCQRCWENANFNMNDGVVADQGYLDFGPALFDSVKSYRRGDHDVARWNLQSLGVHWDETYPPQPRLLNGERVLSYHAAFVDGLGLFELKCGWDALNYFFSRNYSAAGTPALLYELSLFQQSKHWLDLSRWLALADKAGWLPRFDPAWIERALSLRGRRLLSLLARGRKVEWNGALPVLPESKDPWIKANREHFQLLSADGLTETSPALLRRPA